jgi:hypothetical protein
VTCKQVSECLRFLNDEFDDDRGESPISI